MFGPRNGPLHWVDGRDSVTASSWLQVWQREYRARFNRRLTPDQFQPVYNAVVQGAVLDVQRRTGLPATGLLDASTWAATWTWEAPKKVPPQVPKEPTGGRHLKPQSRKSWHYWRRFSNYQVQYGTDPDAPPWWPGRPFGRHEKGWHVREVQSLLGVKETGTFNADTQRRVAGLQRIRQHPVSGIVDLQTALLIDPGPWPETDAPLPGDSAHCEP